MRQVNSVQIQITSTTELNVTEVHFGNLKKALKFWGAVKQSFCIFHIWKFSRLLFLWYVEFRLCKKHLVCWIQACCAKYPKKNYNPVHSTTSGCLQPGKTRLKDEFWNWLIAVLHFSFFIGPKRIQIPHRLLWDLGADITFTAHWSGWKVQVWVQVLATACHLALTSEGYSRGQSKFLIAESMAWLLEQTPAQVGLYWLADCKHEHRAIHIQLQLLLASTGWQGLRKKC